MLDFSWYDVRQNSKTRAKKYTKRLRKKKHIGEYTEYLALIAFEVDKDESYYNTDEFVDKVICAMENNGLHGSFGVSGNALTIVAELDNRCAYSYDILDQRTLKFVDSIKDCGKLMYIEYSDGFYGVFE